MKINRPLILIAALSLQVASWFDLQAMVATALNTTPTTMTSLQTAQLVSSGVLVLLWFAIKPEVKQGETD